MPSTVSGLAELARREAGEAIGGAAGRAAMVALALAFIAVAFGFFVASATWALVPELGVVAATSTVGAGFVVAALIMLMVARSRARRRAAALTIVRQQRKMAIRQFAVERSFSSLFGFAGVGQPNRAFIVPVAAAVALGWFAERRLRRP